VSGGQDVARKQLHRADRAVIYQASAADCGDCAMKPRCINSPRRMLSRHLDDEALERRHARATPQLIKLRRSTVEHPFGTLKYRIFGHPRLLMRGLQGAKTEIAIAIMAYNLKRIVNIFGAPRLTQKLSAA
jgi:Transposase DDE domain